MVDIERCYALYCAIVYILKNKIEGDFVECGVWRAGSCMMIANMLLEAGVTDRKIWLYDTFSGMVEPSANDGKAEMKEWKENKISEVENDWCRASLEEVKANMKLTNYPGEQIRFVKGKVEDTIPDAIPSVISLLRLDTDWYESTRHELIHLYPLLQKDGVLIIDDYGAWEGARKATDEYFTNKKSVFLNRIDWTGRLIIK